MQVQPEIRGAGGRDPEPAGFLECSLIVMVLAAACISPFVDLYTSFFRASLMFILFMSRISFVLYMDILIKILLMEPGDFCPPFISKN